MQLQITFIHYIEKNIKISSQHRPHFSLQATFDLSMPY